MAFRDVEMLPYMVTDYIYKIKQVVMVYSCEYDSKSYLWRGFEETSPWIQQSWDPKWHGRGTDSGNTFCAHKIIWLKTTEKENPRLPFQLSNYLRELCKMLIFNLIPCMYRGNSTVNFKRNKKLECVWLGGNCITPEESTFKH